jgi:FkbM family methyltransferase
VGSVYSFLKNRALTRLPEPMLGTLKAWHYRRVLRSFSDAEEPDVIVVRKLVEPASVALDLGANIGVYTTVLSELVGRDGRVISVEPIPQTFALLSRNVRSLGLTNVTCINAAVSDASGEALMELPENATGGTNFYQARVIDKAEEGSVVGERRVHVSTVTLDTLAQGHGKVGFVKCDVEGHELACLTGAGAVLGSHFPAWLVEVSGNPDERSSNAWKTCQLFEAHSYMPWWFDRQRLMPRNRGDQSTNYFFLRAEHVSRLRERAPGLLE